MDKKVYTESRKYKSPSTGEYITCAQYLAEILVKRNADNKRYVLPNRYWSINGPWKSEFIKQVSQANKLIKEFSEEALINFVNKNIKVFSLRPKYNVEKIAKEHLLLLKDYCKHKESVDIDTSDINNFVKQKNKRKTLLGKISE